MLEHQPTFCSEYPPDNAMEFTHLRIETDSGVVKDPKWKTGLPTPACDSKVDVVSSTEVKFTWQA